VDDDRYRHYDNAPPIMQSSGHLRQAKG